MSDSRTAYEAASAALGRCRGYAEDWGSIARDALSDAASALASASGKEKTQAAEIERLRLGLSKIAAGYPCETVKDMRRVAAETLGVPETAGRNADRSGDGQSDTEKADIDIIIRDLCELPDDVDPEQGDALTVTVDELRIILTRHLDPEHA